MPQARFEEELEFAIHAVERAGELTLEYFRSQTLAIEHKARKAGRPRRSVQRKSLATAPVVVGMC